MESSSEVRIDKWLWAARFFKTRAIANRAVRGGKVHRNGERVKPGHPVRVGDMLRIQQGFDKKTIKVISLSEKRGPATEARLLYEETEESLRRREENARQRRMATGRHQAVGGKPSKRERRQIIRFIRQN